MSEGFGISNAKCFEFFCLNKSKRTSVLLGQVKDHRNVDSALEFQT